MNKTLWVVVVTEIEQHECDEGQDVTCQVVSGEYEHVEEAQLFAHDVKKSNPTFIVDVCTVEEAEQIVTD
jgi:hypothetical protein